MLPTRKRGRQTKYAKLIYERDLVEFAETLKSMVVRIGFKVTIRGLCYLLEQHHGLPKSEFKQATKAINRCRERGLITRQFIIEEGRTIDGVFYPDNVTPEEYVSKQLDSLKDAHEFYKPVGVWQNQIYFPILVVEKSDLKSMWASQCIEYQLPVVNSQGWSSISLREDIAMLFAKAESEGKKPIILHAGDHDATGLAIPSLYHEHFDKIRLLTGWNPKNLLVNRFTLTHEIVDRLDGWIDYNDNNDANPDKPFKATRKMEREYRAKYGARKCESNVLVSRPQLGRQILQQTIESILDYDSYVSYLSDLRDAQNNVRDIMDSRINFGGELLY